MPYQIPVFPLPQMVLFPRTHVTLHVFEPRYRQMMEYAMANGERLAVGHLCEGYEDDYFGAPRIYRVATTGRILWSDKLEDGRWNISVEGIERIRILSEPQSDPFRIAEVVPMPDEFPEEERSASLELMRDVAAMAEAIIRCFPAGPRGFENLVNIHKHPSIVADVIGASLVFEAYDRQSILAERNVLRRLKLINIQLRQLAASLSGKGIQVNIPQKD